MGNTIKIKFYYSSTEGGLREIFLDFDAETYSHFEEWNSCKTSEIMENFLKGKVKDYSSLLLWEDEAQIEKSSPTRRTK